LTALQVLSLDDPANPQRVGALEGRGSFSALFATDGLLCAAGIFSGFEVIDVARPEQPRRLGRYRPTQGHLGLVDLAVDGQYAYVLNSQAGLQVLDISDPEAPRRVGGNTHVNAIQVTQMSVAEGAVFLALGSDGLLILDEFRDDAGALRFRRGDANDDGQTNLADAVYTLNHLFRGGPEPNCLEAADSDDNGAVNLTDPVRLLNHLFQGGPAPPAPGPIDCGEDPAGSPRLGCRSYSRC
jgi:hypothetical protein